MDSKSDKRIRTRRKVRDFKKNLPLLGMALPGMVFLFLFSYLPMGGIVLAFKNLTFGRKTFFENFMKSDWVGLKNFQYLFSSPDCLLIIRNTLLYNLAFIILGTCLSIFIAIALNELLSKRLSKFYQNVILLPYFLSWVVFSYLFYAFLSIDHGILNRSILPLFGTQPIAWYSEPKYWPGFIVFANLLKYTGYNSVVYLAALTGIDQELYEVAALDGAGKWDQIRHITIPLLMNVVIIMTIFSIGRIFSSDFGLFYQLPMQ